MCATCGSRPRTVVASFPHAIPSANSEAEWAAGEARAQQPEAHVHFSLTDDAFVVVIPQPVVVEEPR
ncbi:hypothetical protein ACIOUE_35725 [Streptomyces xanthochromogenes]|uniref:hypothetical protein n=1 Tax=Streptomyces xanthochromogenes TaxID=67384 RepID=UPI003821093B